LLKLFYFWNKSKIIEKLLAYISDYSHLLPVLLILLNWKILRREFIILGLYCISVFLLNLFISDIFDHVGRTYYLIYTFIEYVSFSFLVWYSISSTKFRRTVFYLSILFVAFQFIYFFLGQRKLLDSVPIGVETIFILVYIFYFLFEQLRINLSTSVYNNYFFWINIGILIYLSGTFFFYILVNHLPVNQIQPYWYITYIFDILKNLMLSIGIYICSKTPKNKTIPSNNIPFLDY